MVTIIGGDCEGNTGKGIDVECTVHQLFIHNAHFEANGMDLYSASSSSKIFIRGAGARPLNINGYGYIDIDGLTSTDNGKKVLDLSNFHNYKVSGINLKHAPLAGNTGSAYFVETKNLFGISGTGNLIKDGLFPYNIVANDNWLPWIISASDITAKASYSTNPLVVGRLMTLDCSTLPANAGFYQRFKANVGERVTVHIWANVLDPTKTTILSIRADGVSDYSEIRISNTTLQRYTLQYKVPVGATGDPYILIRDELGGGNFTVGGIVVHKKSDLTGYLYSDDDLNYKSYVMAYQNANQSIPSGADTKLTIDVESYDLQNEFASSRFTASKSGIYRISAFLRWGAQTSGTNSKLSLYKNGLVYLVLANRSTSGTANDTLSGTVDVMLSKGDYLELYATCSNATSTQSGSASTFLTVTKVN
jgi:hypothetical protein